MIVTENKIKVGSIDWFYRESTPRSETDLVPVVLLHGLPTHSYLWRQIMPGLANQGTRCIAPDWVGFGFSAKPELKEFNYTPDAFINALAEFLQALKLERFSLVVQGFLGSVGLQYALRHAEQIESLAILNTPLASSVKLPWQMKQWGLPLAGDMLTQDPLLVDRTLESGSRYRIGDRDLDIYRQPFLKSSSAGRSLMSVVRNLQLPSAMAEIEAGFKQWQYPTTIIWGMTDPWLPPTMAQNFAAAIPHSNLIQLEEAAHYPQEHFYNAVLESLLPFVRRVS